MKEKGEKQQRQKRKRCDGSYSDSVRAKWFCCAFKLGFVQWMCKASLIFKSNLELALPIILKKENYTSQSMLWWSVNV